MMPRDLRAACQSVKTARAPVTASAACCMPQTGAGHDGDQGPTIQAQKSTIHRRITHRAAASAGRATAMADGFTLIEVLVALTIVSVALMACLRAVGSITASSSELRARTLAQWSAENRLTEIRVRAEFPAVGRRNYPCPQGDLKLECQEDVYTTANPNFRRIEIQVFDTARSEQNVGGSLQGGRLARLVGFAVLETNATGR